MTCGSDELVSKASGQLSAATMKQFRFRRHSKKKQPPEMVGIFSSALLVTVAAMVFTKVDCEVHCYTKIRRQLVGLSDIPVAVPSIPGCIELAYANGAAGMEIEETDDSAIFMCRIFRKIEIIIPKPKDSRKHYLMADPTDKKSYQTIPSVKRILNFETCRYREDICESLRTLREECKHVNNEDCERDAWEADLKEPTTNLWSTTTSSPSSSSTTTPSTTQPTTTAPQPKTPCQEGLHLDASGTQCCSTGYEYSGVFQKCLAMFDIDQTLTTQSQLNSACINGGVSLTIKNEAQNEEIRKRVVSSTGSIVIGLQVPEAEEWAKDAFRWVSGSESSFTNWNKIEPNNLYMRDERITFMDSRGGWTDTTILIAITGVKRIMCMKDVLRAVEI